MQTRNLLSEQLILLTELPELLPKKRGKKVHPSTCHRWSKRGCRGRKLETCRIGNARYTSIEAFQRFAGEDHQIDSAGLLDNDAMSKAESESMN